MTIEAQETTERAASGELNVWPADQEVEVFCESPTIVGTHFEDAQAFRQTLIEYILELGRDPEFTHQMPTGGSKVRRVDLWDLPEAKLVNQRALSFFVEATKKSDAKVDLSWASIYTKGSYLTPHGHPRTTASVLYCLDLGDPDYEQNHYSGKLVFTDPRIDYCCNVEEGCVTRTLSVHLHDGMMLLFPGPLVHFVHPYNGTRPRITMSWNIN
ncbi:MAG: putative 2OG-Fe(II) oxygenase [Arenicellales bacterium]